MWPLDWNKLFSQLQRLPTPVLLDVSISNNVEYFCILYFDLATRLSCLRTKQNDHIQQWGSKRGSISTNPTTGVFLVGFALLSLLPPIVCTFRFFRQSCACFAARALCGLVQSLAALGRHGLPKRSFCCTHFSRVCIVSVAPIFSRVCIDPCSSVLRESILIPAPPLLIASRYRSMLLLYSFQPKSRAIWLEIAHSSVLQFFVIYIQFAFYLHVCFIRFSFKPEK
jgi:hypothetical protein